MRLPVTGQERGGSGFALSGSHDELKLRFLRGIAKPQVLVPFIN
jgi:hypothetical protein